MRSACDIIKAKYGTRTFPIYLDLGLRWLYNWLKYGLTRGIYDDSNFNYKYRIEFKYLKLGGKKSLFHCVYLLVNCDAKVNPKARFISPRQSDSDSNYIDASARTRVGNARVLLYDSSFVRSCAMCFIIFTRHIQICNCATNNISILNCAAIEFQSVGRFRPCILPCASSPRAS